MTQPSVQQIRDTIREHDRRIVQLLDARAQLAVSMGEAKRKLDLEIHDPVQEREVLARLETFRRGPLPASALRAVYREILAASHALQVPGDGRICVSIVPATPDAARDLLARASAAADLVEVRLDDLAQPDVAQLLAGRRGRIIVTDRSPQEGGRSPRDEAQRVALLAEAVRCGADYVDVELRTAPRLIEALQAEIRRCGGRTSLILSWHDMQGTPPPAPLEATLREAQARGADIAKIVTTARGAADADRVLALHETARQLALPLAAFCMGEAGRASRIEALRRGSVLGYASLDDGAATASGQWPVARMRELVGGSWPRRYAVVGNPVRHSLSPLMFTAAFAALDLPASYEARELSRAADAVTMLRDGRLQGASVTIPFKTEILPLVDDLDEDARRIGAVNTVVAASGRLRGANTDWIGLARCLAERVTVAGTTVAVLGAGGAARAAVHAIQRAGGEAIVVCRDVDRGQALGRDFGCRVRSLADLVDLAAEGIVNATPASPAAPAALSGRRWVMDMIYKPARTQLLADAEAAGCVTIEGLAMLVHQGAAQFALFTGRDAPRTLMAAVAGEALRWAAA